MLTLIHGSNQELNHSRLQKVLKDYRTNNPTTPINYYDCSIDPEEINLSRILHTKSLFSVNELIILKRVLDLSKVLQDYLISILEHLPKDLLIWSDRKVPSNTRLYKKISKLGKIILVEEPNKRNLRQWIKKRFEDLNKSISNEAIEKLIYKQSADPKLINHEIDKLSLIEGRNIDRRSIEKYSAPHMNFEIWTLLRFIENKDSENALMELVKLFDTKVDPYFIFNMIIREYRITYLVKSLKLAGWSNKTIISKTRLHPFVVSKTLKSRLELHNIKKRYQNLINIDYQNKLSLLELETALVIFVKLL